MSDIRTVKYLTIALIIMGGWFGLHRVYHKSDYAVVMAILGISGLVLGLPLLVSWVWSIVDLVRVANADDASTVLPPRAVAE
jgi:multisubunit Na+/H+ antiporter MnhG subunit